MPDWLLVFSHTCSGVPSSMPETSASATTFLTGAVLYMIILLMSLLHFLLRNSYILEPSIMRSTYSGLIDNNILHIKTAPYLAGVYNLSPHPKR